MTQIFKLPSELVARIGRCTDLLYGELWIADAHLWTTCRTIRRALKNHPFLPEEEMRPLLAAYLLRRIQETYRKRRTAPSFTITHDFADTSSSQFSRFLAKIAAITLPGEGRQCMRRDEWHRGRDAARRAKEAEKRRRRDQLHAARHKRR